MTSSLVGSEMCIRDSIPTCCPRSPAAARPIGARRRQTDSRAGPWACRLYTSDAADECRSRWS
eukprot:8717744-Prorocentrum_lima.AAC.1